jgi:hypothetical protein
VNVSPSLAALWLADAFALATVAAVGWRLARRYPSIPPRVPLRLRLDGRPVAVGSKAGLWLAPVATLAVTLALTAFSIARPPSDYQRPSLTLVFVICAEAAWYVGWTIDRLVEIARGMTVRIAPGRIFGLAFPILATMVIALVVAFAASL